MLRALAQRSSHTQPAPPLPCPAHRAAARGLLRVVARLLPAVGAGCDVVHLGLEVALGRLLALPCRKVLLLAACVREWGRPGRGRHRSMTRVNDCRTRPRMRHASVRQLLLVLITVAGEAHALHPADVHEEGHPGEAARGWGAARRLMEYSEWFAAECFSVFNATAVAGRADPTKRRPTAFPAQHGRRGRPRTTAACNFTSISQLGWLTPRDS